MSRVAIEITRRAASASALYRIIDLRDSLITHTEASLATRLLLFGQLDAGAGALAL